ncbi:MAG: hypothetical protein AAF491_01870, partial [Verrucomicrobiota bacterium]
MTRLFRCLVLASLALSCPSLGRAQESTVVTERARTIQERIRKMLWEDPEISNETTTEDDGAVEELSREPILPELKGVLLVGDPTLVSETEPGSFSKLEVRARDGFTRVPPPEESVLEAARPFL